MKASEMKHAADMAVATRKLADVFAEFKKRAYDGHYFCQVAKTRLNNLDVVALTALGYVVTQEYDDESRRSGDYSVKWCS